MEQLAPKTNRIWVLPATPLFLISLFVVSLFIFTPRPGRFVSLGILTLGGLSLLVGVVALVMILRLRARHGSAVSKPTTWVALVLAVLDIAIPVAFLLFIVLVLSQIRAH